MRVLRLPEVLTKVGLSRSYLYAQIQSGRFPQPIDLGDGKKRSFGVGASGWIESEIDAWIKTRIAKRDRNTKLKGIK